MKNKKFIVVCSNLKIPVDQDELIEVYRALTESTVKFLRRGAFNPSFFVGIQEDEKWMDEFRSDKKYQIRDGEITEYPKYEDMFPELREQVKALQASQDLKQLP